MEAGILFELFHAVDWPRCVTTSLFKMEVERVCVKGGLERGSDSVDGSAISEGRAAALANPGISHKSCLFVSMMTDI